MTMKNRDLTLIAVWAAILSVAPLLSAEETGGDWEFRLTPHIWIPTVTLSPAASGDVSTDTKIPASDVVAELDAALMLNLEVRKGRWGLLSHGMYTRIGTEGSSPGPFFNMVDTTITLGELDLALFYRVLEGDRGWLDLLAGARYMYTGLDYEMTPDYEAIDAFAADLVNDAVNKIAAAVEDHIDDAIDGIAVPLGKVSDGEEAADILRRNVRTRASLSTDEMVAKFNGPGATRDSLRSGLSGRVERSTRKLASALQNAVADGTRRRTDSVLSKLSPTATESEKSAAVRREIQKSAGARVRDIKKNASSKVRKAIEQAEQELATALKDTATKAADADHAESKEWVEPFVGVRGRINLTDRIYAGARADVGGAGMGSDLAWQVFGGLGWTVSRHIELEAGWRYLAIDFEKDNYVIDATFSGAMLGLGIPF